MIVYPYKQKDGYCSILEAVNRDDARQHLKACSGKGVRFCEVGIAAHKLHSMYGDDIEKIVNSFLQGNRNYVT